MLTAIDPIEQHCRELIEIEARRHGIPPERAKADLSGRTGDVVELALRDLVASISFAVKRLERAFPPLSRTVEEQEAIADLIHFKVPDARDHFEAALRAVLRMESGVDKVATLHDEMAKRGLVVAFAPLPSH